MLTSPPTWIIDAIVVFLVLETVLICLLRVRARLGDWYTPIAGNVAGLCLLLALRLAMVGADSSNIFLMLLAAFVAHGIDLHSRIPEKRDSAMLHPKGTP